MDSPSRRSVARSQRRSHNASPYSRSKSVAGGLSRSGELPLHAAVQPASAIARTSSIRSLFNLISSPFRSAAPAAAARGPSEDGSSESEEDDGFSEEDERDRQQARQEGLKFGQREDDPDDDSDDGAGRDKFAKTSRPAAGHQWAAANPLAAFSPRVKPEATHAHALLQMEPSPGRSVPRYLGNGSNSLARSSTMPALDSFGRGDGARRVLRAAEVDPTRGGRIQEEAGEVDLDERMASDLPEAQRLFTTGSSARAPELERRPLFHPGSATATPPRPTTHAGSINGGFARSNSNLSFLSPSRFSARNPTAGSSSSSSSAALPPPSPGTYSFASRPETGTPARGSSALGGTPARRRPIYVGPGTGSPASLRKRTPAMALEFLRSKEEEAAASGGAGDASGGTPGKRRRIDGSGQSADEGGIEEALVERELGGLFGAGSGSSGRSGGLSSSSSVPVNLAASGSARNQPSSPFTFKPPPAPPVAAPLVPEPALKRSYSTLPARIQLKNPSLVAPSPLRQSTSFGRDSPEGKAPPADLPASVTGGKRKERTESAKLLLGLINEEKAKTTPVPPPTPAPKPPTATPAKPSGLRTSSTPAIQNPYQAIASPSPRRNPRRSVAATNRSSKLAASTAAAAASSPAGERKKAVTALDLIEQDVRSKEGPPASPSPAASKRPSAMDDDEPEQPAKASPVLEQPTPVKAAEAAPPAWASTPPPVVHFAPPPKVSTLTHDVTMDGESPTKRTLDLFKTLESPAFAKTSASTSTASPAPASKSFSFEPAAPAPTPPKPAAPSPAFSVSTSTPPLFTAPSADPQEEAARKDKHLLPIFTFVFNSTATPLPTSAAQAQAMREAKAADKASLPTFDLLAPSASSSASAGPSTVNVPVAAAPPTGGFNWGAVGMAPPKPAADKWTCGVCMISNGADRTKCAACEEPAPKKAAPASGGGGGFNWSAAGMQKPTKAADSWTCGICAVVNPTDKAKCAACEEPQPKSATPTPAAAAPASTSGTPASGFNWAMAGVKPPAAKPADSWPCGVCMLTNAADKAQCPACEEPRPKAAGAPAPAAAPAAAPAPAPAAGGFNWGAAGLAAPAKKAGWECGVCMVPNDATAVKCVACESPK